MVREILIVFNIFCPLFKLVNYSYILKCWVYLNSKATEKDKKLKYFDIVLSSIFSFVLNIFRNHVTTDKHMCNLISILRLRT